MKNKRTKDVYDIRHLQLVMAEENLSVLLPNPIPFSLYHNSPSCSENLTLNDSILSEE